MRGNPITVELEFWPSFELLRRSNTIDSPSIQYLQIFWQRIVHLLPLQVQKLLSEESLNPIRRFAGHPRLPTASLRVSIPICFPIRRRLIHSEFGKG